MIAVTRHASLGFVFRATLQRVQCPMGTGRCVRTTTQERVVDFVRATMPARSAFAMLMLQIVIRPSMDSDSIALLIRIDMPWPPPVPILAINAGMCLADTPSGSRPSALTAGVNGRSGSVWVASTCDVPMPIANAPNAPWVEVWLSPQTIVIPGWVRLNCGPTTMHDALLDIAVQRIPNSAQFGATISTGCVTPGRRSAGRCRRWARCNLGGEGDRRSQAQAVRRLRAGDLMHQMRIV